MNSTRELSTEKTITVENEKTNAEITFDKVKETDNNIDLWWGEYYQGTIRKKENKVGYYNENVEIEFDVNKSKIESLIRELALH